MQETFTDWALVSLSPYSRASIMLVVAAVVIGCGTVLWSYRGAQRRWLLTFLRITAALLVIGFLVEPAVQLRVVRKTRNRLAMVVDRSRSMSLNTTNGTSRYAGVLELLESDRAALEALAETHIVEWFDLERPVNPQQLGQPPTAEQTDLMGALERAREMGGGRPLAGVVLITDGADNANLQDAQGGIPAHLVERLEKLDAPVNVIDAAFSKAFRDVAITEVLSDEFAFLHNTLAIEVTVSAVGLGQISVPVTLKREGALVATQVAVIGADGRATVTFKPKPDKIGEFVYSVSIPDFGGDAIAANNNRSFVLQVIRDKIRVLHVTGRPSWDERFLRQHLKENPNVDLISFFILRTPTDDNSVQERELSLIPFPVQRLFTTELASFDVVIFQNFDYRPYNMAHYLRNIRDAVKGGLGFIMLGGELSFGRNYQGTPLDEVIPVSLDISGMRDGTIAPALTPAGRLHPITDLTHGAGSNDRAWKLLPPWSGANITSGLMPGATALVGDGNARTPDGQLQPLMAVMDVGDGRSMAVLTDSLWRWRFTAHRKGRVSERAYHRFWSNTLRWLVRDPEHSRIRVLPRKRRYDVGEAADVTVRVLGQDYQPVPFAKVRLSLEGADGTALRTDDLTAGDMGIARQRYEGLKKGAYRLRAEARNANTRLGEGRGVFVVESTSVEISQGAPRPRLMQAIADTTGGALLPLERGVWDRLEVVDPEVIEVARRKNVELWDNAIALIAAIILLAIEWSVRRRRGYL